MIHVYVSCPSALQFRMFSCSVKRRKVYKGRGKGSAELRVGATVSNEEVGGAVFRLRACGEHAVKKVESPHCGFVYLADNVLMTGGNLELHSDTTFRRVESSHVSDAYVANSILSSPTNTRLGFINHD